MGKLDGLRLPASVMEAVRLSSDDYVCVRPLDARDIRARPRAEHAAGPPDDCRCEGRCSCRRRTTLRRSGRGDEMVLASY